MKKLKIRGITGMPLFLTKLHGYLDGKREAVVFTAEGWSGHYIEKKQAIYCAFLFAEYRKLEHKTAALHKESTVLAVEYENVKTQLAKPDAPTTGATVSSCARSAARLAAVKPNLRTRKQTIEVRIAAIEEELIQAINEVADIRQEAGALVERRIHAYLHGVSLAVKYVQNPTYYKAAAIFDSEADFKARHRWNDDTRKNIITGVIGGEQNGADT